MTTGNLSNDVLLIGVPYTPGPNAEWNTLANAKQFLSGNGVTELKHYLVEGSTHFFFGRCDEKIQTLLVLKGCSIKVTEQNPSDEIRARLLFLINTFTSDLT